jgi:predicted nucleic-acid-binding Zn-ribbon protein
MDVAVGPCSNCGGRTLYRGPETSSGGGKAPTFLPGLGSFLRTAKFTLVVCRDCGLTRFFASADARAKLKESSKWKAI